MSSLQPHPEYENAFYIEEAIGEYKERIPRSELLAIGEEALREISERSHMALMEMLLWEEVV